MQGWFGLHDAGGLAGALLRGMQAAVDPHPAHAARPLHRHRHPLRLRIQHTQVHGVRGVITIIGRHSFRGCVIIIHL